MASLIILGGGKIGDEIPLRDAEVFRIGRSEHNDFRVRAQAVSGQHLRISLGADGDYFVEDCRSRNGTALNRRRLEPWQPHRLKHGDRIRFCNWELQFNEDTPSFSPSPEPNPSGSDVKQTLNIESQRSLIDSEMNADRLRALLQLSEDLARRADERGHMETVVQHLRQTMRPRDRTGSREPDRILILKKQESDGNLARVAGWPSGIVRDASVVFSSTIIQRVLDSRDALLFDVNWKHDQSLAEAQSIVDTGVGSAIVAPLLNREREAFGLILVDVQRPRSGFTIEDLSFLVCVASQAAAVLENARLSRIALRAAKLDQDLQSARYVQRSFLPAREPSLPGYDFHTYYESARNVGGDYYDFIADREGRLGVFLGDVSGKGMPAALVMTRLSFQARTGLLLHQDLLQAVEWLNGQLCESNGTGQFVTLSANLLDPVAHRLIMVSAGHPSPLIYRRHAHVVEEAVDKAANGTVLGIEREIGCTAVQVDLQPGDVVILFTDGVTEAGNRQNQQFGRSGIQRAVLAADSSDAAAFSVREIGNRVIRAVQDHQGQREQEDDIALVCFGRQ